MKKKTISAALATSLVLGGMIVNFTGSQPVHAAEAEQKATQKIVVEDTFDGGYNGWSGGFSDYPPGTETEWRLSFSLQDLPKNLTKQQKGLHIAGSNHSDDLFMYVTKPVHTTHKVKPNTTYKVDFDFDIATNTPSATFGVGGSPGDSVFVKAGAATVEPKSHVVGGHYRLNADHGQQAQGGANAALVGTIGKVKSTDEETFEIKNFNNKSKPYYIQSDSEGKLWLLIGTDSGYEAYTQYYFSKIKATLTEVK
ncbi:hypothetical protein [Baia soyae]|uniref:Uncharacterized protein n=1 Tax=Baia soyae TaxID=1544746 RepID=A0A4R2RJ18_9BACL|nr:hypothetical protein [Baia soyae]TCP62499.1 hypothetical protein EDD57_15415 [Baia soyae]